MTDTDTAPPAAPASYRILARKRDWNARCNGVEVHRVVRLPTGETGWAADVLDDVEGSWLPRGDRAANRDCRESGCAPAGTVIVEFERAFRQGQGQGRAAIRAGMILEGAAADSPITWGLGARRRGDAVVVTLPDGQKVEMRASQ